MMLRSGSRLLVCDDENLSTDTRTHLPWVNENPTKGKWRAEKAGLAGGGQASWLLVSESSTSKLLVSVGLDTSGMYGAVLSRSVSQSTPTNHGWCCRERCVLRTSIILHIDLYIWYKKNIVWFFTLMLRNYTCYFTLYSAETTHKTYHGTVRYLKVINAVLS